MRTALGSYARNFIIQETFTMNYGYHDIESVSLGMFLSGFAGHDGIRSDSSGWYAADGSAYPLAAGAPHLIEHLTLTGETYFDGPELIWTDTVQSLPNGTTADGYTRGAGSSSRSSRTSTWMSIARSSMAPCTSSIARR